MFKLLLLSFIAIFYLLHLSNYSYEQKEDPVTWKFHVGKVANNLYEVDCHAFISPPWHIYPTKMRVEEIGIPTTIMFNANPYLKVVDTIEEKGSLVYHDAGIIISRYYEREVILSQYFSLKAGVKTATLKGIVQWQSCTLEKCLPVVSKQFTIIITRE